MLLLDIFVEKLLTRELIYMTSQIFKQVWHISSGQGTGQLSQKILT